MVYDPALGYDPELTNQALALQGGTFRVPTLADAQANAAQFPALPLQGEGVSMLEQAAAAQALPSSDVSPAFSMVPTQQAPVMRADQPSPVRAPPVQAQPPPQEGAAGDPQAQYAAAAAARQGGGGGGGGGGAANPLPGMLADTTARRQQAEAAAAGHELKGDEAVASLQQSAADLGDTRAATYADIAAAQKRVADEAPAYQKQLKDAQDSYERAASRAEAEQRDIAKFISDYEPKDRRSTSKRMMSALAVGLAGMQDQNNLVAGLMQGVPVQTNNANQVMGMIQSGIDRDLDMQRAMLDNKKTALAAKSTELGQVRARFGDGVDSLKLARAMKLEQSAQEIEALKARGLSQEAQTLADQTIAGLQLERANTLQGVSEESVKRYYGDEQRLKMARAAQLQAGRPKVMSPKEALELEGKALANEKARRELAGGPEGKKLTEGQAKLRRDIIGAQDDIRAVAKALRDGVPYFGVRGVGSNAPDVMTPTASIKLRNAILSGHDVAMRDKSGAAIGKEERASDLDALGVFSGDADVAQEGLRKLNRRIIERAKEVGIDPAELGLVDPAVQDLTRPLSR